MSGCIKRLLLLLEVLALNYLILGAKIVNSFEVLIAVFAALTILTILRVSLLLD